MITSNIPTTPLPKFKQYINGRPHYFGYVVDDEFIGPVSLNHVENPVGIATTLFDKDGDLIYSGDILSMPGRIENISSHTGQLCGMTEFWIPDAVVAWDYTECRWAAYHMHDGVRIMQRLTYGANAKIIGSILNKKEMRKDAVQYNP